jgi:hypothetical protein
MREDPYPARFYGRLVDEPFTASGIQSGSHSGVHTGITTLPAQTDSLQQSLTRTLFILLTLYLFCAIFFIFTVSSYAAPSGSMSTSCVETAALATD